MIAANKTRKGHSSHRGVMGMPPVDLASGDKHAPVEPAAARRPAVAPPSAIGLEAPVVLAGARNHLDTVVDGIEHSIKFTRRSHRCSARLRRQHTMHAS
jgi:hypothetical protein